MAEQQKCVKKIYSQWLFAFHRGCFILKFATGITMGTVTHLMSVVLVHNLVALIAMQNDSPYLLYHPLTRFDKVTEIYQVAINDLTEDNYRHSKERSNFSEPPGNHIVQT